MSCAACVVTTNAWTYNRVLFHPRKHQVTVAPVFFPLMLSSFIVFPSSCQYLPFASCLWSFCFLYFVHPSLVLLFVQHSNPGHAGPFPVASLHNANPTSPTSASMAGAHAHRSPASPIIGPIELIPSVTNPENLPCLPEIPPIQVCIFQLNNVYNVFQISFVCKFEILV